MTEYFREIVLCTSSPGSNVLPITGCCGLPIRTTQDDIPLPRIRHRDDPLQPTTSEAHCIPDIGREDCVHDDLY